MSETKGQGAEESHGRARVECVFVWSSVCVCVVCEWCLYTYVCVCIHMCVYVCVCVCGGILRVANSCLIGDGGRGDQHGGAKLVLEALVEHLWIDAWVYVSVGRF